MNSRVFRTVVEMSDENQISRVADKLRRLKLADSRFEVFGASSHEYELASPKTEEELSRLEERSGIELPVDYRSFLLEIGDGIDSGFECGGAGPGYGLFRVETIANLTEALSQPFPLTGSILNAVELDESQPQWHAWHNAHDRSSCGAMTLAHYGCGRWG